MPRCRPYPAEASSVSGRPRAWPLRSGEGDPPSTVSQARGPTAAQRRVTTESPEALEVAGARRPTSTERTLKMGRRTRRAIACALAGVCTSVAVAAPSAQAFTFVYTDLSPFNLAGTWTSYGGGTQFHISSTGDGTASYRWLDITTHDNYISGNSCSDVSQYGQHLFLAGV